MPIRRINSTGRKRILLRDVKIHLNTSRSGALVFEAVLDLGRYGLPGDSLVFVEAYRQTTFMRFPFGTVAAPTAPKESERRLHEFASADALLFRVRVTAAGEPGGMLLAEGDRIPPGDDSEQPESRVPLLPPLGADLGQEIWRVDFSGQNGPLLEVNNRVGDWKAAAKSAAFRSLVYPAAMRQVLWHIYKVEGAGAVDDGDDAADWRCRWLVFASSLPGVDKPPPENGGDQEWERWIARAVAAFCKEHRMLDTFKAEFERLAEATT